MTCADTTTATIVTLQTGTGWTLDVTALNLDADLSVKDFQVVIDSILQNLADYTKTTRTLITYSGAALPTNTRLTFFRFTPIERTFCPTFGNRLQSSQYNEEFDRLHKIMNESRASLSLGTTFGRVVQASPTDTMPSTLINKLAAGTNISLALLNPGANEQIQITSIGGGGGGSSDLTAINLITTDLPLIPQPTPSTNAWVAARGRDNVNDGGEGLFYWDEADTTSPADEGIIYLVQGGAGTGRWKRYREDNYYWDVRWYGVRGDGVTDNYLRLNAMGDTIVADYNDAKNTIIFPASNGSYDYSRNTWIKNVRLLRIEGYGAKLRNTNATSPWAIDRYPLALLDWFEDNNKNQSDDFRDYKPTYAFDDVAAGSTSITMSNPGDAANFNVGEHIFISGLLRQSGGYPPNLENFEWHEIIDITGDVITFRNAIQYTYDNRWFSFQTQPTAQPLMVYGSPVATPQVGPNGSITPEIVELLGIRFLLNPNYAPGSKFNANAWRRNYIKDVIFDNVLYTTISEEVIIDGCRIEDNLEIDKVINRCTVQNCQIGRGSVEAIAAGSGVRTLTIKNNDVYGRIRVHPILQAIIQDNKVMASDAFGSAPISHGPSTFTTQLFVAERNVCTTEAATPGDRAVALGFGDPQSLTVDSVGASNEIYLINNSTNRETAYEKCSPGIIIYTGDDSKRGVVTNIYNVLVPGDFVVLENEVNATINPGDVFYWNTVQNATLSDNSWIQNGVTEKTTDGQLFPFQNEGYKFFHVTSENRPFIGSGGSGDTARCYVERIEFNVTQPYTGAFGGSVDVEFSRFPFAGAPTPVSSLRQRIDLKTVGYRSVSVNPWECTTLLSAGDQLVTSEMGLWNWALQIRYRQGSVDLVEPDDTLRAKGWYRVWVRNPRGRGASRYFKI